LPSKQPARPTTKIERADPALEVRVAAVMATLPVYRRPMFGVVAWFVEENAQLLGNAWGESLTIRVGAEDAAALVASGKATHFDPMGGRPMREYVLVPAASMKPVELKRWIARGLAFTSTLPHKKGK